MFSAFQILPQGVNIWKWTSPADPPKVLLHAATVPCLLKATSSWALIQHGRGTTVQLYAFDMVVLISMSLGQRDKLEEASRGDPVQLKVRISSDVNPVTQDLVQLHFENLPRQRFHHVPGEPFIVLNHSQAEFFSYYVQLNLVLLQHVVTVASCWAPQRRVWLHPHENFSFYCRRLQIGSLILFSRLNKHVHQTLHRFQMLQPPAKCPFSGLFPLCKCISSISKPQTGHRCSLWRLSRSYIPLAFWLWPFDSAALYAVVLHPLPKSVLQITSFFF